MKRTTQRVCSAFLVFVMLLSMIPLFLFAVEDQITKENIQSTTFIKTGRVETLINKGDKFFIKTEYFNYDGKITNSVILKLFRFYYDITDFQNHIPHID